MADTESTQDNDDGSVYWMLGEALHWIAFRKKPPPDDDRSVADFDKAERELATAYKSGKVRLLGRDGEFSRRKKIPVLQLDDPHFEAAGNAVYEKPEPWDSHCWIDVRLDRQEVLAEWPDPDQLPRRTGRPTYKSEIAAAYRELLDAGEIDFNAPKTRLYEPIRKKVREYKGDPSLEKGLRDEAIRKVIHPLFDGDKNERSASP